MESIYTELALYGSINECVRTDNVFSPISEICDCTVSLVKWFLTGRSGRESIHRMWLSMVYIAGPACRAGHPDIQW